MLIASIVGSAETIHVPDDHGTIQAAVDAAVDGDTIIVRPGTYTENVDYSGKEIAVLSEQGPASTVIDGNIIAGNIVMSGGSGGLLLAVDCAATVQNNVILGNQASTKGGGIDLYSGSSAMLKNNTIFNNSAKRGGGIACREDSMLEVRNTILWQNTADFGPSILVSTPFEPSHCSIFSSCVEGGQDFVHLSDNSTLDWGPGMIEEDPLFEDPAAGDLALSWLSPCINRGTSQGAPLKDIEGDPRPFMGLVDMGAYEFSGDHPLEAEVFAVSGPAGGSVEFSLRAGSANLGRQYLVLGSLSGTAPGTSLPLGKAVLRLNCDDLTDALLLLTHTQVCSGFFGLLDSAGTGTARLNMPPAPGYEGTVMHFAFCLDNYFDFVSNPLAVEIVP
jgi:parallel beta-helix repeat protein